MCILILTGNDGNKHADNVELALPGVALLRRALWVGFTDKVVPEELKFAKRLGMSSDVLLISGRDCALNRSIPNQLFQVVALR